MAMEKIAAATLYTAKFKQQCSQRDAGLLFSAWMCCKSKLARDEPLPLSRVRGYLHVMSEEAGLRARSDRRIRGHALGPVVAVLPELRNADNDWSIAEVSSSAALQQRERLQSPSASQRISAVG